MTRKTSSAIHFHDFHPIMDDIRQDIVQGLRLKPKQIPPKYFYDEAGSKLFEQICQLPEYYLTRTEMSLLRKYGSQMAEHIGNDAVLLEFGSGSSSKIRLLLDAIQPSVYLPLDISRDHLRQSVSTLAEDYPWLTIHAVCVDYAGAYELPLIQENGRRIAFFPGSSIGNLDNNQAITLLNRIAKLVGHHGGLLIGVDLVKDTATLEAAYNDTQGITAKFNKNLLLRLNRELHANFKTDCFQHKAFFNRDADRIEMHLVSDREQTVTICDEPFTFARGETIHTENSYKYTLAGFRQMALSAGFHPTKVWTDSMQLFSIHYLQTAPITASAKDKFR